MQYELSLALLSLLFIVFLLVVFLPVLNLALPFALRCLFLCLRPWRLLLMRSFCLLRLPFEFLWLLFRRLLLVRDWTLLRLPFDLLMLSFDFFGLLFRRLLLARSWRLLWRPRLQRRCCVLQLRRGNPLFLLLNVLLRYRIFWLVTVFLGLNDSLLRRLRIPVP